MLASEQGASIVRRNLNTEAFEQITFKIPSYEQQIKIGYLLSCLQKQLEIANCIKRTYNKQKQYLLKNLFI